MHGGPRGVDRCIAASPRRSTDPLRRPEALCRWRHAATSYLSDCGTSHGKGLFPCRLPDPPTPAACLLTPVLKKHSLATTPLQDT